MPPLSPDDFLARLAKGEAFAAVLLLGTEAYLREVCRARLISAFVPESARDWGVSRYSAANDELEDALGRAQTLPMLCAKQVVVLEEVEALEKLGEKSREEAVKRLSAYLDDPAPFTVLVLEAASLDQRMRLAKVVLEKTLAVAVELGDDFKQRQLVAVAMAQAMARDLGVEMEPGAADDLADLLNADLTRVHSEMEKLATYAGERKKITREDVSALVVSARKYTVWELADMLATQQGRSALEFLDRLLRDGEQPVALIGAMAWMFRKLIEAQELPPGAAGWQAARTLSMRPEAAEQALRNARRIPRERLLAGLQALYDADSRLKSRNPNPRALMEFLVGRLTGARASAAAPS